MQITQSRRDFLACASLAAAAGALGGRGSLADEGAPETTTVRLHRDPSICIAPGQIAEAMLRAEGFTDIRYIPDIPVALSHAAKSTSISILAHGSPLMWMRASQSPR
jgi:NitT/TauT family transport system substrate-binding protein